MNVLDTAMHRCCYPMFDNVLPMYVVDPRVFAPFLHLIAQVATGRSAVAQRQLPQTHVNTHKHVIRWEPVVLQTRGAAACDCARWLQFHCLMASKPPATAVQPVPG